MKFKDLEIDVYRFFFRRENFRVCVNMKMIFKIWIWVCKEEKGVVEVCVI